MGPRGAVGGGHHAHGVFSPVIAESDIYAEIPDETLRRPGGRSLTPACRPQLGPCAGTHATRQWDFLSFSVLCHVGLRQAQPEQGTWDSGLLRVWPWGRFQREWGTGSPRGPRQQNVLAPLSRPRPRLLAAVPQGAGHP